MRKIFQKLWLGVCGADKEREAGVLYEEARGLCRCCARSAWLRWPGEMPSQRVWLQGAMRNGVGRWMERWRSIATFAGGPGGIGRCARGGVRWSAVQA